MTKRDLVPQEHLVTIDNITTSVESIEEEGVTRTVTVAYIYTPENDDPYTLAEPSYNMFNLALASYIQGIKVRLTVSEGYVWGIRTDRHADD